MVLLWISDVKKTFGLFASFVYIPWKNYMAAKKLIIPVWIFYNSEYMNFANIFNIFEKYCNISNVLTEIWTLAFLVYYPISCVSARLVSNLAKTKSERQLQAVEHIPKNNIGECKYKSKEWNYDYMYFTSQNSYQTIISLPVLFFRFKTCMYSLFAYLVLFHIFNCVLLHYYYRCRQLCHCHTVCHSPYILCFSLLIFCTFDVCKHQQHVGFANYLYFHTWYGKIYNSILYVVAFVSPNYERTPTANAFYFSHSLAVNVFFFRNDNYKNNHNHHRSYN